MELFLISLSAIGGYVACWYSKDALTKLFTGAKAFADSLEAKAAAIKAAL